MYKGVVILSTLAILLGAIQAEVPINVPVFMTTNAGGQNCKLFYSRDRDQHGVYCSEQFSDDQLWVFSPQQGHYTITNYRGNSHRIYASGDGRFGFYSGPIYRDQLWDIIEEGNHYVVKSVDSGKYLYASSSRNEVGVYYGGHSDQQFVFLIPPNKISYVSMDYRVNEAQVLEWRPVVIASQRLVNDSPTSQGMTFSYSEEVTETTSFSNTAGVSVTVGTSFSVGVPLVAEADVSVEVTASYEHTWGTEESTSTTVSASYPLTVPGNSVYIAKAVMRKARYDVPFIATIHYKGTSYVAKVEGLYKGVSYVDLEYTVDDVE